jgi:hypothetical protein
MHRRSYAGASVVALLVASTAHASTTTDIANLALANLNKKACSTNSLGGKDYESSCTGNGGYPEYWCADFAQWVWANTGVNYTTELNAAAGSFYLYGQKHGTLKSSAALGDVVVFDWHGDGTADHVAVVTKVNGDGTIETASGDWGGQSGTEAQFASTSTVVLNAPAYPGTVGSTPGVMGMTISGFIAPVGVSALPELEASFVGQGSSAPADPTKAAYYRVCAGDTFTFWFEVKNTGAATWTDVNDTAAGHWGKAVRLQTSNGKPDVLAGVSQVSINDNATIDVSPGGTTKFTKAGITGKAPATPGVYKTSWSLVDEGRGTFGPGMWLSYDVVDCQTDAGLVTHDGGSTTPPDGGADGGTSADPGQGGCAVSSPARSRGAAGALFLVMVCVAVGRRRSGRPDARASSEDSSRGRRAPA